MKIDPFAARRMLDDILSDRMIERLTNQPIKERIDPSRLSHRGRELIETLRLFNPLARAVLAGDRNAAGTLQHCLMFL